ncbi:conserved unknown protein [Ectocarpus siliculosus]|uniref:Uncharacterized protein n=1 Tax=Ectocarpus siliculosus TaxID=2880 RepID=D7FGQ0_ECTSI|nr:conserved unknown protein [Ectocarpus siliculosus]|eukprot:CBJ28326.1 conserved unknown protein [Ectocarpus siliculosus]
MPKRRSFAMVACTTAVAALMSMQSSTAFVPTTTLASPPAALHSSRIPVGRSRGHVSQFQPGSDPIGYKVGLERRAPALPLSRAGRRSSRRSQATAMVFGGGGGGGRGGGGFRLDPGTIATIGFGLLFVFAPGVIFGAFNTLFLTITVGPILFSAGLNLYNRINLVDAPCPVCGVDLQGLKNKQNQCPSCGAMLLAKDGKFEAVGSGYVRDEAGTQREFSRMGDSGVIDVDAIDVDD